MPGKSLPELAMLAALTMFNAVIILPRKGFPDFTKLSCGFIASSTIKEFSATISRGPDIRFQSVASSHFETQHPTHGDADL